ncbi:glycosyltransferase [Candidatus Saccharibacteria bacterium]|nr:glycosyltransferase [Candidatus Saccharibacteria bacterium]
MKKILIVTSTLPTSDSDPVPGFVSDQAIWLKKLAPTIEIDILAPHNIYSKTKNHTKHPGYTEHRFHYFWPSRWELLTGRGIQPALQQNKLLFLQIPFLFLCEFLATYRLTRKIQPDLLYAHWFTPQGITTALVAKLTRTPFVFTTHASDVIVLKRLPFSRKLVTWACKQAACYTAVSQQTAKKLLYFANADNRQIITDKLHIIPMGTEKHPVSIKTLKSTRKSYDLTGKTIILLMGRLVDIKGFDIVLDAFAKIKEKERYRVLICGDGPERAKLEAQATLLGISKYIRFMGFVSGKIKDNALGLADIVIIPSRISNGYSEGLPVVFMEAVLNEKITIVSNVTGAQEVITDGIDGFVFQSESKNDLLSKLTKATEILNGDSRAFYRNVRTMSKQFEWKAVARKHLDLFDSLELDARDKNSKGRVI